MKYILVIGDGMADAPIESLGAKTPLEAATKPYMDDMASRSRLGHCLTVPEGFAPGSDTAIMSIFGCNPQVYFSGRAPLELAAAGRILPEGAAAYRCNMVTLGAAERFEDRLILSHSAGSIEGEESDELITWLFSQESFKEKAEKAGMSVLPGHSFRHLAIQQGGDIEGIVLIPPHDHLNEACGAHLPSGNANAEVLLELMLTASKLMAEHPINKAREAEGKLAANCVWFWAEGKGAKLPNFTEQYAKTGGVISAVPLCHGIGRLVGLRDIHVEGATGEWDTDYAAKAKAALECLETDDFVCVHVEAPDEATHNNELDKKIMSIGDISEKLVKVLCESLNAKGEDFRMLILSDHRTYMSNGAHGGESVPYMIYDSRKAAATVGAAYTEDECAKGDYLSEGIGLMPALFEL